MRSPVVLGLVVLCAVGCADKTPSAQKPVGKVGLVAVAPGGTITGTLLEQIPVDPYSYVRLETPGGEVWAAVNQDSLTVGQSVTVYNVMLMEQFESKTLKRTFGRIYFGALEPPASAPTGPGNAPPAGRGGESVGAPPASDANVGTVARATGANAFAIGELWAQQAQRTGTTVSVRGVVVKYNAGVMGKNWIHLQDGTGSAASGTHDLTATSMGTAAVGDTVTVTGVVRRNRDFGAGYTYALLLEDATVVK